MAQIRWRGTRLQDLGRAAFPVLAAALLFQAAPGLAVVPVPNGVDPGPCSIIVYWDDTFDGCEEVQPDSDRGLLMTAAGENAVVVMRAWRRRNPELIVPAERDTTATGASEDRRRVFADVLRREMSRTFSVDSMAVAIASDSIGASSAVLRSRYWLARSVRQGKGPISRQIGRVDYREDWRRVGERWVLGSIEEVGELAWELGAVMAGTDQFPNRPGRSMSPIAIDERLKEARRLLERGFDDRTGESRPAVDSEPVPFKTIQPVYPEFAKEARIQGKVILDVLVGADGVVENIHVAKGVTALTDAAIDAVKRWIFEPAIDEDGNPIAAWTTVPVDFHF